MKSLIFCGFVALLSCASAQEGGRPEVPQGVRYKFIDDSQNSLVRSYVAEHLLRGSSGVSELLIDECMCAPGVWKFASKIGLVGGKETSFEIPNRRTGKLYRLQGASISEAQDLHAFARYFSERVGAEPVIRRLTAKELRQFWIVVPFDIEEPVFMVEAADARYVICLKPGREEGSWRVWWIDDLTQYDYGDVPADKKEAEQARPDNAG